MNGRERGKDERREGGREKGNLINDHRVLSLLDLYISQSQTSEKMEERGKKKEVVNTIVKR